MARSKPVPKAETKTSALTRVVRKQGINFRRQKEDTTIPDRKQARKRKRGKEERRRPVTRRKARAKAEKQAHPLALAFSSAIGNSRTHIKSELNTQIDKDCESLTQQAMALSKTFNATRASMQTYGARICKPFGEDELQFTSEDGKTAGTMTIHERMAQFKSIVAEEEKNVRALESESREVNESIEELAREALGPADVIFLEDLLLRKGTAQRDEDDAAITNNADFGKKVMELIESTYLKAIKEELEQERKIWEEKIDKICQASMAKMEACEKEMDAMQRKQRLNLLNLLDEED